MRIRLNDIPEEGKSFLYNRKTGELNAILADLIADRPHQVEFVIRPLNTRDFEMSGTLKTDVAEECSRCGDDFDFNVDAKFREILIPRQPEDRTGRYAKVNHLSDVVETGPSVSEYDGDFTFDIGEYLHEQTAIAVPFNPAPCENSKGDCSLCGINLRGRSFSYVEEMPEEKPQNAFSVLKNLKM